MKKKQIKRIVDALESIAFSNQVIAGNLAYLAEAVEEEEVTENNEDSPQASDEEVKGLAARIDKEIELAHSKKPRVPGD